MADTLVSGDQPSSSPLYGVFIFIISEAIAGWGCLKSIIVTAFRSQPAPQPPIENFIIRIKRDSLEKNVDPSRRDASLTRALSDSRTCECGRPRASSDPTNTVSRPEVFAERAANRMRKCMNICGAAAAKTVTTPAGPIIKGARLVLKGLSIKESNLATTIEVDEDCDDANEAADIDETAGADDAERTDETRSSAATARSRAASVATSTASVVKFPATNTVTDVVECVEAKTVDSEEVKVVEELPKTEVTKRKRKFRKFTRKLTIFASRASPNARA